MQGSVEELVPALEAEGALRLTTEERAQLLAMSARTIDRRLRLFRLQRDPRTPGAHPDLHPLGGAAAGILRD